METRKTMLTETELPKFYYNILADLENPLSPPLNPGTKEPIGPDDLAPIFPMGLIRQEVSTERFIEIPKEVLDVYKIYRPTPLVRARNLEKHLDTPAKIYYKNESVSPTGSHKTNTAIAQAFYNKIEGVKKLSTETGAGQWGSALSFACNIFDMECSVYMVRISYEQKPHRRTMMELFNAKIVPSPSDKTNIGQRFLAQHPDTPGSLGIAISEALEEAVSDDNTKYSLGSVLSHVLLHQTIIGLETEKQLEIAGDAPDVIIGCCGGGSNLGGISFPFIKRKLKGENIRVIAVEPKVCPSLTCGDFKYDFGDTGEMTPLLEMFSLGHGFVPPPIHAGGLRYHGAAPLVSRLVKDKLIEAQSFEQTETFEAGAIFTKTEGIIPAPESAHAVKSAIQEAVKCKSEGKKKVIIFNLSGHGHFDMSAYENYLNNGLST
ncbi:TrpB-like pyridoxal phosphate-dependent enzyme [candidate division KSB1 bacterium]